MKSKVAIVEKVSSTVKWDEIFNFSFDKFALCNTNKKKVLKRDITLDFKELEPYEYIITVGAESTKFLAKVNSVTTYQGIVVNDKYIPLINPAMLSIKPEGQQNFDKAVKNILNIVNGIVIDKNYLDVKGIETEKEAIKYLANILKDKNITYIAVDTETTALYPRDGYVLGIGISHKKNQGVYIDSDCISEKVENLLQEVFNNKKCIFHNAKFDIKFLWKHFGFNFPDFEDTMLLHALLDENNSHKLKDLAIKYTKLGDYDAELEAFKRAESKRLKIKLEDFTYDLIPFEILAPYGATDPAATIELFELFYPKVLQSTKLNWVYSNISKPGIIALAEIENNGVPFNLDRLNEAKVKLNKYILSLFEKFYEYKEIIEFEEDTKNKFNPNSPAHLQEILFNKLGLPPSKLTDTGNYSTDKEVLASLIDKHPVVKLIAEYKKWIKIKNTYIDKIIKGLDSDGRLRTNFNQHTTTSGRLSSSGKLNLQQLPRDIPVVKWCIKAKEGNNIISADLGTAEIYIAAFQSKDKVLTDVFRKGGDYHGFMAVYKYGLDCDADEVKKLYPDLRQEAKTVSFEILYKLNLNEPVLEKFVQLKSWLIKQKNFIENNGYIYSFFGRKRRLLNVTSSNREIVAHDVRSGVNFLFQSVASDVNLIAAIKMQNLIKKENKKSRIFALVHDSIVAEVPDEEKSWYCNTLKFLIQEKTGVKIPNIPIKVDIEIGEDYAFGKGGESFVL